MTKSGKDSFRFLLRTLTMAANAQIHRLCGEGFRRDVGERGRWHGLCPVVARDLLELGR